MVKFYVHVDANGYVQAMSHGDGRPPDADGLTVLEASGFPTNQPSENHRFHLGRNQWEDIRSVADVKAAKWAEIKALRDEKELSTFVWDGSTFDIDGNSQRRLLGVSQLAMNTGGRFSVSWTLADGSTRTLGYVEIMNLSAAIGAYVAQLHETARQLKAAIAAAQTVDQVKAIQWEG